VEVVPLRGGTGGDFRDRDIFLSTDRTAQADWLETEEREWLATEMEKERQTVETYGISRSIDHRSTLSAGHGF
jgi:hypothetical protein